MQVVVLNQSDPLRQVVQFIAEQGYNINIVAETDLKSDLLPLIDRAQPDYLFLLQEDYSHISTQIPAVLDAHSELGIALVNEEKQQVLLYKENFSEEQPQRQPGTNLLDEHWLIYSLSDFIYLMTEDGPREVPPGGITAVEKEYPTGNEGSIR